MAKGESWYEAYTKSKAYKEGLRKFQNKLYFNKKFREDFFETLEEGRDGIAKIIQKAGPPRSIQEARIDLSNEEFLDKFTSFAATKKVVEQNLKGWAITDGKFRLYRRGKETVFTCSYKKGGKKKLLRAYLYLKGGIPAKARREGVFIKQKAFGLGGYFLKDRGVMYQFRKSFQKTTLKFVGKNKYKFVIYIRGSNPEYLWVERAKR